MGNKKCRIYTACDVSQTPIRNEQYEDEKALNVVTKDVTLDDETIIKA